MIRDELTLRLPKGKDWETELGPVFQRAGTDRAWARSVPGSELARNLAGSELARIVLRRSWYAFCLSRFRATFILRYRIQYACNVAGLGIQCGCGGNVAAAQLLAKVHTMAKKAKAAKSSKTPAAKKTAASKPAAKLTRRNATPVSAILVLGKPRNAKSAHNKVAWAAILPLAKTGKATAAKLAALPVFSGPNQAKLVSGPMHISYLQRNFVLVVKGTKIPA